MTVTYRIGLISDTHGLLRPEAVAFLRGCNHIIHGGDIGKSEVIRELSNLAPVTAVRGNIDRGQWAESFPQTGSLKFANVRIFVLHELAMLANEPHARDARVIVSGHSHKPLIDDREGILYVNPGSAGPRRFKLPITAGELVVKGAAVTARIKVLCENGR